MKKLFSILLMVLFTCSMAVAQVSKDQIKERKQMDRYTESRLKDKASKTARKQAKKYAKEGWTVAPGHLPLERQLDRAYMMQYEVGEDGYPLYIYAEAISVGQVYDAAKMQALELAKLQLAGKIETDVTSLIETTAANSQISADDAVSLVETVQASKNLISKKIGRILTVVEAYRDLPGKKKEVRLMVFYNSKMAMAAAKQTLKEQLEEKGNRLHEQLDKVLGF